MNQTADKVDQELVIDQDPQATQEPTQAQTHELSTQQDQPNSIMAAMIQAAANPEVDIERVKQLLDIRNELAEQESEKAYAAAMSRTQAKIGPIVKNKENRHTKSSYSDLAAINAEIIPVYTSEGFALSFSNKSSENENHIVVMCDVMHSEGHSKHYEYDLPFDGVGTQGKTTKTAIHASASSMSYGQRYLTTMIFNIATFDDDGNASSATQQPQGITAPTLDKIQQGMEITGKSLEDCLKYINGVFGADHARLTQFSENEGQRMLHKLNKCADGDQQ